MCIRDSAPSSRRVTYNALLDLCAKSARRGGAEGACYGLYTMSSINKGACNMPPMHVRYSHTPARYSLLLCHVRDRCAGTDTLVAGTRSRTDTHHAGTSFCTDMGDAGTRLCTDRCDGGTRGCSTASECWR
eukprot:3021763-Rhodomonas_salina.1